jgi:hypothetical protein
MAACGVETEAGADEKVREEIAINRDLLLYVIANTHTTSALRRPPPERRLNPQRRAGYLKASVLPQQVRSNRIPFNWTHSLLWSLKMCS